MLSFKQFCLLSEQFDKIPGTQYGSNVGGQHVNPVTGEMFYVKFPRDEEQAHVEAATAELYKAMGIRTLEPRTHSINGMTAVVSKWQPQLKSLTSHHDYHREMADPHNEHTLAVIHHAAVITANRDVVGQDHTNVMKDINSGELVSADQGGSMHYRAQGEHKPFEANIEELHAFANPGRTAGRVFSSLDQDTLKHAALNILRLTDAKIDATMDKHGLTKYAPVIKARRDLLLNHYGVKGKF
jgi:hypothetical protein